MLKYLFLIIGNNTSAVISVGGVASSRRSGLLDMLDTIRKLLVGHLLCRPRQMPSLNLRSDPRFHRDIPIGTAVFDGHVQVMG
ncbi:uncharacterized protein METZ01_LOCUS350023, partial [marine metagenome]